MKKSEVWKSSGGKINVQIVKRLDGEDGIQFWSENSSGAIGIRIEEAEAISQALAYFKNKNTDSVKFSPAQVLERWNLFAAPCYMNPDIKALYAEYSDKFANGLTLDITAWQSADRCPHTIY